MLITRRGLRVGSGPHQGAPVDDFPEAIDRRFGELRIVDPARGEFGQVREGAVGGAPQPTGGNARQGDSLTPVRKFKEQPFLGVDIGGPSPDFGLPRVTSRVIQRILEEGGKLPVVLLRDSPFDGMVVAASTAEVKSEEGVGRLFGDGNRLPAGQHRQPSLRGTLRPFVLSAEIKRSDDFVEADVAGEGSPHSASQRLAAGRIETFGGGGSQQFFDEPFGQASVLGGGGQARCEPRRRPVVFGGDRYRDGLCEAFDNVIRGGGLGAGQRQSIPSGGQFGVDVTDNRLAIVAWWGGWQGQRCRYG